MLPRSRIHRGEKSSAFRGVIAGYHNSVAAHRVDAVGKRVATAQDLDPVVRLAAGQPDVRVDWDHRVVFGL
ncbi:MAG TPA: hypothetical protein VIJ96_08205 [Acidothermaceae bacterium]